MWSLHLVKLSPEAPAEVARVQAVLAAAPGYSLLTEARLPADDAGLDCLAALPPGKAYADKFAGVLTLDEEAGPQDVAAFDLIRGYPEQGVAYLGLLVFTEAAQGRGFGPQALGLLSEKAGRWGCTRLRLGVISTNVRAHAFWQREGFVELYRKDMPGRTGPAIVMERPLSAGRLE